MKRPRDKMTKRSLMGDLEGKMRRTTFSIFTTDRSNVLEIYETIDSISLHWCVSKQHWSIASHLTHIFHLASHGFKIVTSVDF